MKKKDKEKELTYLALNYDWNTKEVYLTNIFRKDIVKKIVKKIEKKEITSYDKLREELRSEFIYHFMSRSEYEMMVGSLYCSQTNKEKYLESMDKVSVYDQIEPNLDIITKYMYSEMNLKDYFEEEK